MLEEPGGVIPRIVRRRSIRGLTSPARLLNRSVFRPPLRGFEQLPAGLVRDKYLVGHLVNPSFCRRSASTTRKGRIRPAASSAMPSWISATDSS